MTILVVCVVSGALLLGAAWGIYGKLPQELEGFLIALAGGALIVSALSELIEPALEKTSLLLVVLAVGGGALVFTIADKFVEEKYGSDSGGGLLASITLDGIPENLALGVALIGAGPMQVAALAGSIFLSNLPEAAGGAKDMAQNQSKGQVFWLWAATAVLLSAAAIAGNILLAGTPVPVLCRDPLFRRRSGDRLAGNRCVSESLSGGQLYSGGRYRARPASGAGPGRARRKQDRPTPVRQPPASKTRRRVRRELLLDQSRGAHAAVSVLTNNQMVVDLDAQPLAGLQDFAGECDVGAARGGVSAGVIVDQDKRG